MQQFYTEYQKSILLSHCCRYIQSNNSLCHSLTHIAAKNQTKVKYCLFLC